MIIPGHLDALLIAVAPIAVVSPVTQLIITFGPAVLFFWFLIWRPQQKQRRQHETALRSLKRGDEIVTSGGIVGEVIHIKEGSKDGGANRMDDRVTIKSGESRLIVERGKISRISTAGAIVSADAPAKQ
ncbi:MAG: preprotein translocase subunit YajC [Gemmatimonadaceae bacterium]